MISIPKGMYVTQVTKRALTVRSLGYEFMCELWHPRITRVQGECMAKTDIGHPLETWFGEHPRRDEAGAYLVRMVI